MAELAGEKGWGVRAIAAYFSTKFAMSCRKARVSGVSIMLLIS